MYQTYRTGSFLKAYSELSETLGQKIEVVMGTRTITGVARHFNDEGALVIQEENGKLITVASGEVTKVYLPENGYHG